MKKVYASVSPAGQEFQSASDSSQLRPSGSADGAAVMTTRLGPGAREVERS